MSCEECKAKEEGTLPPTLSLTYVTPGPSDKPDLRSIVLAAPCSLALIVKQLRNTFAETPSLSAFQDPQRKPTHTTLVSMDEFNQILKLYGEKPPSNGDEWKAFDETESAGKAAVVALAQHRKAYFEEHGLRWDNYVVRTSHKHIDIGYFGTGDTMCHTTIAYWKEGLTPEQRIKAFAITSAVMRDWFNIPRAAV